MADKNDDITLTENVNTDNGIRAQSTTLNTSSTGGADDLTEFVHNILKSTQSQFETMSNKIINRIDDVSRRVDELERSITDLMNQAGVTPEQS
ncbi:Succinate dehydrogenase [ubiquinone] iron-sulfur subunit, mitochondrial [Aphelenchoides besseyi]|nr:Succinate dehydrogenase [ubiquinone] iron-sulfur subunit, mitochondrial [Aphelenchoides besseyi]KAI6208344.1 Succinate dehydrogenase [ubiquinone] iron-sulfur subunit, mitochondrial [Aphelenchoides besseyi]